MAWSSRGGDVIHWYESDESERAVCGASHTLASFLHTLHCHACIRIVQELPDLSDPAAVEVWLDV